MSDSESLSQQQNGGLIVVLSAPSGAGKTSVLKEVLNLHPEFAFSTSITTREPRKNECDGVDYQFISEDEFVERIDRGEFIEWAVVHGHRYGTLKCSVSDAQQRGQTIILDTDTVGASNIKKLFPEAILIFIIPPSLDILTERLKLRNTESPKRFSKRLSAVPQEIKQMKMFDYIVLNDTLEVAVSQVMTIIGAENLKSNKMIPKLSEWRNYLDN